jgi:hypothetical protein
MKEYIFIAPLANETKKGHRNLPEWELVIIRSINGAACTEYGFSTSV